MSMPPSLVRSLFVLIGGGYILIIALLTVPFIQTHTLYLHALRLPWFSEFDAPEKYGLAPGKTLNFNLTTSDNVQIGAWFILSDSFYQTRAEPHLAVPSLTSDVPSALEKYPTILFFHGNAGTRAFHQRIHMYSAFSSRLRANVLAIDYRGYGDSEGSPTEDGLAIDARAAWNWVIAQGAPADQVLVIGHSLGSAAAARFAAELGREDVHFRGLVLMAPFSSIRALLDTYNLFRVFPLMKPLAMIPHAPEFITRYLLHKFNTLALLPEIKVPIVIAHAENDWEIPYSHSEVLFNALLESLLPPVPSLPSTMVSWTKDDWDNFNAAKNTRIQARKEVVLREQIHNFGSIEEFNRGGDYGKVVFLKTLQGGHDRIGMQEGVQDVIVRTFELL